jgi:UDP-N-acetylglucosamine 4,6-dehydratase/UDP-glucose 4-epimerase
MIKIKENKLYLVTGGSGFLGQPLVKYILENKGLVRVISRDEGKLIELKEKYPAVDIYTGDISDLFEVRQAMKNVTGVFHLAASKHVGLAEKFVRENIKTNIIGSLNILENSLDHTNLEFILSVSTDKAAQVAGVYGATKFLMERAIKQYEELNPNVMYRTVRYGNVLYSTGSVLCKWKDLISQGKDVIVTAPEATRFFWSVDDAIQLIIDCMADATDSTPYCPIMKSMRIDDLFQAMIQKYSNGQTINVNIIGLQPGENMHEKVLEEGPFSNEVEHFTIEEILTMI